MNRHAPTASPPPGDAGSAALVTRSRVPGLVALATLTALTVSACAGSIPARPGATTSAASAGTATGTTTTATTPTTPTTPSTLTTPPPSVGPATPVSPSPPHPSTEPLSACAAQLAHALTPSERAGQLLMVGLSSAAARTSLDGLIARRHLGGVVLLGGWSSGVRAVARATGHLTSLRASPTQPGLLIAADQEGGAVQQLRGEGFSQMPSALAQSSSGAVALRRDATRWAHELAAAGINVNLAPVADTVPASLGTANQPIGRYDREFSHDPVTNARLVAAFVGGMRAGGMETTVKHFPGLGRITGNTDLTATGITDRQTTKDDPYLEPFRAGIKAGAGLVMVGSAIYTRIDPGHHAVFSRTIITDLLRHRRGYDGVVISDDVGVAKSVAGIPTGERATRFVAAGGDIVLTARPATIPAMHDALTARMARDRTFAHQVQAAVTRVLALKLGLGLTHCP